MEQGPLGTQVGVCTRCHAEVDLVCPACHPEVDEAFRLLDDADPLPTPPIPALPAVNDLDHIQVRLTGPWTQEDLRAVTEGFQAAAEAAKADGLTMEFVAVKKRSKGLHAPLPPELRNKLKLFSDGRKG